MFVAAVRPPDQFNRCAKAFVQHCVIENEITRCIRSNQRFDILPQQSRRQLLTTQIAIDCVMTELLQMLSEMSEREVALAAE